MSTMLSRSGRTNPGGKLTQRFDVPVSEELNEAVIALATIEGISKAEWLRRVIERTVWGELSMLRRVTGRHGAMESEEKGRDSP